MPATLEKPRPWIRVVQWVGAALVLAAVVWAARSLDLRAVGEKLLTARTWPLVLAALVGCTIPLLVALQWYVFAPRDAAARYWHVWRYTVLAIAAWSVLPSVVGVGVAAAVFAASGIGSARAATILGLDQLGNGVAKGLLFLATASLVPLATASAGAKPLMVMALALLGFVVLAAVVAWARKRAGAGSALARHLAGLPDTPRLVAGVGLSCAVKVVEGLVMVCIDGAMDFAPSLSRTLLALSGVSLATLVGVGPANLGLYEGSVFSAYRLSGVAADSAASVAILQHAAALLPTLVLAAGVLAYQTWQRATSRVRPQV
ncbi:MAG: lysylphosphatidylglycerol synthase transmembrane domain-containing protein [Myxococcales bacterium]